MSKIPNRILIVGGGTAGWMTAIRLQHAWPQCQISLIESADIGTVGVGEGATPYLKQFFKTLGIPESEWMPQCDATYKLGISFENWSQVAGYQAYFHPFFSALDKPVADMFFHNCGLRRRGFDANATPDEYFVASTLAQQKRHPVSPNQQIDIDYAYHFDAAKLGRYLRHKATSKGLKHLVDTVEEIRLAANGQIQSIVSQTQGELCADFYIDCTGFAGKVIQQSLGESLHSYQDMLFNDAAVAIQTPYEQDSELPLPQTRSIALKHGWMWQIPLTQRQGNGYVYSRSFIQPDQAETELRRTLNIGDSDEVKVKHLSMKVGRLSQHWRQNCLAVGLSQGFIEPLEATALMLTQLTVERFIEACQDPAPLNESQQGFNRQLNQVFDGIRDYIVAHYKLNTRTDSDYWLANANNPQSPETLQKIFSAWDGGKDVEQVLSENRHSLVYLRPSWYCILAGMGRFPTQLAPTHHAAPVEQARRYCQQVAQQFNGL